MIDAKEGRDIDGAEGKGDVTQETRVQQGGEAATTRFGMNGPAETDDGGAPEASQEEAADGNQSPGPGSSGN